MKNVVYLLIALGFLAIGSCEEESTLTLKDSLSSSPVTIGIQPSDILVAFHWGGGNVCYPAVNDSIPYPYKDSVLVGGSSSFIWNAYWPTQHAYSTGCFGAWTSYLFKMDSVYPGQIRVIPHNGGGTRIRKSNLTNKYDWNEQSTGEHWDRSKLYAFGKGLQALINQYPNSKIRLISSVPFLTEGDSDINTDAGDSPTMTDEEARATYVEDMITLYNAMINYAESIGVDTSLAQLQLIETGPGFQVLNRPLNKGIRYAQYDLVSEIEGAELVSTCKTDVLSNGVNYSPKGYVEIGKRLAEIDIERLQ